MKEFPAVMDSFLAWYATMGELDFLAPVCYSRCVKFDAPSDPTCHFSKPVYRTHVGFSADTDPGFEC